MSTKLLDLSCWPQVLHGAQHSSYHPPPPPPAFSPSRRLTKTRKDGGGGRGDKAGSLSTRPEPSLPIFPPTSIDDVVCGGGWGGQRSHHFSLPVPPIQGRQRRTRLIVPTRHGRMYLLLTAFHHPGDIIDGRSHAERDGH